MGSLTVGSVVLAKFPYADLTRSKLRPAMVVGLAEFDNLVVCQITSNPYTSEHAVKLSAGNFVSGGLGVVSYARPDKLFTADRSVIKKALGRVDDATMNQVKQRLQSILEL